MAAVRICGGTLARSLARSGPGARIVAVRANQGAVPTIVFRKLTTSATCQLRSEKEVTEWVQNELSKVRQALFYAILIIAADF